MKRDYLFTSESVGSGHPDKIADQISDAVLDNLIKHDPLCRVACETLVNTGLVVIAGEITTSTYADIPAIARDTIHKIGYTSSEMGFDYNSCAIITTIDKQSSDIAQGVNEGEGTYKEQGAGDQGLMFGYACNETPELMPASIMYAHKLVENLVPLRENGTLPFLRPDCKSQVTVKYSEGKLASIETVVISTQHSPDVTLENLRESILEELIKKTLPSRLLTENTRYLINPTGRFVIGGPQGDCGITGRKIIVDTYGGHSSHGGGCFSGKDPSKVDRSAAYMARYIAKNIVAAGLAEKAQIQLAYAIGYGEPVSIMVDTFGTGVIAEEKIESAVRETFKLTPKGIISSLNLLKPIYKKTAAYGHFGRSDFYWENTDKVAALKEYI